MKKILFAIALFGSSLAANAQELEATEDTVLLEVLVKDFKNNLRKRDQILFEGQKSKKTFKCITSNTGKFNILLPEGDIYDIKVKGLGQNQKYNTLSIPAIDGIYSKNTLTISYEPARHFVLKNLEFDFGKSTIRRGSDAIIIELYDLMVLKPDLIIEVSGHTDNVGEDASNQALSQARAEAIKSYLQNKGIAASRITAKGYGESKPLTYNSTEEGRQKNRRTEVLTVKE